jgi:hypothetical protein
MSSIRSHSPQDDVGEVGKNGGPEADSVPDQAAAPAGQLHGVRHQP